jgi:hypothetical protein
MSDAFYPREKSFGCAFAPVKHQPELYRYKNRNAEKATNIQMSGKFFVIKNTRSR